MAFSLSAFLGGAATGISENIDKYERDAEKAAQIQLELMTKNFTDRKTELESMKKSVEDDANFVASLYSNQRGDTPQSQAAFEDMIFAASTNPALVKQLREAANKAWFDPNKDIYKLSNMTKMLKEEPSGQTAIQQIRAMYDINNAVQNAQDVSLSAKERKGTVSSFASDIGYNRGEEKGKKALEAVAKGLGTTPEQMAGALQFNRPTAPIIAKFDLTGLRAPMTSSEQEAILLSDHTAAKATLDSARVEGDPDKVKAAEDALSKVTSRIESFNERKELFSGPEQKNLRTIANAKSIILNPQDYSKEEVANAERIIEANRGMSESEHSKMQNEIASLQMTIVNTKDPVEKQASFKKLNEYMRLNDLRAKQKDTPTAATFKQGLDRAIKQAYMSSAKEIGNVVFSEDIYGNMKVDFAGNIDVQKKFVELERKVALNYAQDFTDQNGRVLNVNYFPLLKGYGVPFNKNGTVNFSGLSEPPTGQPAPAEREQPKTLSKYALASYMEQSGKSEEEARNDFKSRGVSILENSIVQQWNDLKSRDPSDSYRRSTEKELRNMSKKESEDLKVTINNLNVAFNQAKDPNVKSKIRKDLIKAQVDLQDRLYILGSQ